MLPTVCWRSALVRLVCVVLALALLTPLVHPPVDRQPWTTRLALRLWPARLDAAVVQHGTAASSRDASHDVSIRRSYEPAAMQPAPPCHLSASNNSGLCSTGVDGRSAVWDRGGGAERAHSLDCTAHWELSSGPACSMQRPASLEDFSAPSWSVWGPLTSKSAHYRMGSDTPWRCRAPGSASAVNRTLDMTAELHPTTHHLAHTVERVVQPMCMACTAVQCTAPPWHDWRWASQAGLYAAGKEASQAALNASLAALSLAEALLHQGRSQPVSLVHSPFPTERTGLHVCPARSTGLTKIPTQPPTAHMRVGTLQLWQYSVAPALQRCAMLFIRAWSACVSTWYATELVALRVLAALGWTGLCGVAWREQVRQRAALQRARALAMQARADQIARDAAHQAELDAAVSHHASVLRAVLQECEGVRSELLAAHDHHQQALVEERRSHQATLAAAQALHTQQLVTALREGREQHAAELARLTAMHSARCAELRKQVATAHQAATDEREAAASAREAAHVAACQARRQRDARTARAKQVVSHVCSTVRAHSGAAISQVVALAQDLVCRQAAQVAEVEGKLGMALRAAQQLSAQLDAATAVVTQQESEALARDHTITCLEAALRAKEEQESNLHSQLRNVLEALTEAESAQRGLEGTAQDLRGQLQAAREESTALREELGVRDHELDKLRSKLPLLEQRMVAAVAKIRDLQDTTRQGADQITALQQRLQDEQGCLAVANKELTELRGRAAEFELLSKLKAELRAQEDKAMGLEQALAHATAQLKQRDEAVTVVTDRLRQLMLVRPHPAAVCKVPGGMPSLPGPGAVQQGLSPRPLPASAQRLRELSVGTPGSLMSAGRLARC